MAAKYIIPVCLFVGGLGAGAVARDAMRPRAALEPTTAAPSQDTLLSEVRQLPADGTAAPDALIGMLESLSVALTEEAEYRMVLEEQISTLAKRVDDLQSQLKTGATDKVAATTSRVPRTRRANNLTVDSLIDAGMPVDTASRFKTKIDDIALQRLYLRDQAVREGWVGDPRYREESRRLTQEQNGLRNEFGAAAYDAYLYASGRPNRIEVRSVLDNSPAFEAGLRSGDQIVSYNGERTFQTNELRNATQQGRAGEMVAVQVVRDGQSLDLYIPRGPLGIQMTGRNVKPGG